MRDGLIGRTALVARIVWGDGSFRIGKSGNTRANSPVLRGLSDGFLFHRIEVVCPYDYVLTMRTGGFDPDLSLNGRHHHSPRPAPLLRNGEDHFVTGRRPG
jgi:hypothetical protein